MQNTKFDKSHKLRSMFRYFHRLKRIFFTCRMKSGHLGKILPTCLIIFNQLISVNSYRCKERGAMTALKNSSRCVFSLFILSEFSLHSHFSSDNFQEKSLLFLSYFLFLGYLCSFFFSKVKKRRKTKIYQ